MSTILKHVALFLFVVLSFSAVASAATIYVPGTGVICPSGGNPTYSTIQAAVNAASAGDEIIICSSNSVYLENVNISVSSITIRGIVPTVAVQAADTTKPVFTINADGVTLSDLYAANSYSSSGVLLASGSSGITIDNVTSAGNQYGFYLDSTSDSTIKNSLVILNTVGIYLWSASSNNLTENTVQYNAGNGISAIFGSYNRYTRNGVSNNNLDGFYLDRSDYNTLTLNTADGNALNGYYVEGSHNFIGRNSASNNTDAGFYIGSGTESSLYETSASENNYGYRINGQSRITIDDCTAYASSQVQYYFSSSSAYLVNSKSYDTPSSSEDIYIDSGSQVTTITSTNTPFKTSKGDVNFDQAKDLTLTVVDAASSGT